MAKKSKLPMFLGFFFFFLISHLVRLLWGESVWLTLFVSLLGIGLVLAAVVYVLERHFWQELSEMDPSERDFLRSNVPEVDEFWANRPRAGERRDWAWSVYRIGWAVMAVVYPPVATILLRDGRLAVDSEVTFVDIGAAIAGVVAFLVISRWRLKHYRCRRCGSATVRLAGDETPRFSCARCGIIWNLGNV